jgi:phospholipid/cholesterol/gamma-HCH transport system permease protein
MKEYNKPQLTIKDDDPNNLIILIAGKLDMQTTAILWPKCLEAQEQYKSKMLTINTKDITYFDSAGVTLLLELQQRQIQNNNKCQILHLAPHLKKLMEIITTGPPEKAVKTRSYDRPGLTVFVGYHTVKILKNIQYNISFFGALFCYFVQTLVQPSSLRWKDFWRILEEVGPSALTLIALVGFLIGLIGAFQSAIPLGRFGAQVYIANLVGISLAREMGPLMTAIILASRTASAFSAEIGTMKLNQETDALTTMGLNPIKFLSVPRIIATTLMTPLLNIFLIFFGLVGCGVVMHSLGFNFDVYMNQLEQTVRIKDLIGGMVKAIVFGMIIASIGCLEGLKTRTNASGVGQATTKAVVNSIIMIIIVDGIFALIYYALGV